jgi:hypothetical protein
MLFFFRKLDELLFPSPTTSPWTKTTPFILPLNACKDNWQGSAISIALRASKPWIQPV